MNPQLLEQLVPTGVLRVGVNMSNFLLVMARALATRLGVEARLIPFKGPGQVADAAAENVWDIANIAAEPARAKTINFSSAYCEIQASYLLPPGSPIRSVAEVDKSGNRIAAKGRAAFELWLSDNLKEATVVQAESHDAAFEAGLAWFHHS